ncbi:ComEA family DNA-binding protein [Rhodohalobacter sulfatireducens]|uniref:Helix-hairpin-helix domain-containing protein n=1 Tax=Rhodohalobacter sulfatireducens TaxID=2911366 RepID=A0ABS9KDW5_9BACT|nr:helix-hairpin-helix domain-containing protein [Rhodohalobacter sulfatireducens]MCG2589025.1 helix-hairpin-helix domain-containing protein [Rhodohalobacter sulfatireducens]
MRAFGDRYQSWLTLAKLRYVFTFGIFVISIFPIQANAQQRDTVRTQIERDLEEAIEEIDPEESDLDLEELVEFLESLANNPININRSSVDDLMQIPGLNFRLAQGIVQYRSNQAPFSTVDELTDVPGVGPATLSRIRPYITVGTGLELSRDLYLDPSYWTNNGRFEGFTRYQQTLQEQEGYARPDSSGGYLGSPAKYYQRFRYTSNHLSLNLTQDKDPGEPLSGPTDFDYTSWHIGVNDVGNLQDFVIGDYSVSFGQGLLIWSGGAFGKGRDVTNGVSKNERGIRPFTSAQEAIGFRGIAATYGQDIQVSAFYSNRDRTASIIEDNIVNFPTETGYHRTVNERSRRNNLGQETFGGRIRARVPFGFVGVSGYHNRFDQTVEAGNQPYQVFDFSGKELSGYSADYRFLIQDVILFGEFAYTDNGGYGLLSGADFEVGNRTNLALSYRYYDKQLQSIFGAGFGEQSGTPGNEEGFYIGIEHELTDQIQLIGYFDQFRFPGARFLQSQPTSGFDWLGMIEYEPNTDLNMYLLFRSKTREEEYDTTDEFGREISLLDDDIRSSIRYQAEYQVHPKVRLRTRFDLAKSTPPNSDTSWGYLVFQDIRYYLSDRFQIDARVTMFETEGYDSRVYQFENDLLYVLSNTMLFDQGQRMYILFNYEPTNWLELWMKLSTTIYEDRQTISSGLNEIQGDRRSDFGIQARVRF